VVLTWLTQTASAVPTGVWVVAALLGLLLVVAAVRTKAAR
jgi:hypothetical protein